MIRKLMASSAMIALMTAGTIGLSQAQTDPAQTQDQPAAVEQQPMIGGDAGMQPGADASAPAKPEMKVGEANPTLQPEQPTLATAFIGKSVYSSQDPEADNIGNVNDLIISDDGTITHAVIGVGGFLGIGEKNVAVPFDELQIAEREGDLRLIYAATRENLEAAEEFDRTAYDPSRRNRPEGEAAGGMTTAPQTSMAPNPAAPMATETAETPAADAESAETADATQSGGVAVETQQAEADANQQADATVTAQTDAAQQPADASMQADAQAGTEGFVAFDASALRASTLMGREIYGEGDESIGEVSDLVLQEDGQTRAALIDIGGFLGVGEKEVAIPFSEIQVQQGQEGEEPRLTIAMNKEQLEQLPDYEAPEEVAETEAAPAEQSTAAAPDGQPADPNAPAAEAQTEGGAMLASQDMSADELLGQAVYGTNDDTVGEIDDLVFTPEGTIEAVVIDVGGFLGMGEKPVAVQFDSLNIQKNGDGETKLMINATEDQLKNAPAYDESTGTVQ